MKQPQHKMQYACVVMAQFMLMFCAMYSAKSAVAASDACQVQYQQLDATFEHLLTNRYDTAPSLYDIKLHALEEQVFEAFTRCPQTASLFALMGELQIVLGQPSLAVAYGNKSIQLDTDYWRGYYVRGTGLCLTRECETGLAALRQAIALQPANAALQLNLCSVLVWNGMYEASLSECTAAIQMGDDELLAQAYYLRSQAYKALGNAAPAAADLVMAKKLGFDVTQDVLQIVEPGSIPEGLLE